MITQALADGILWFAQLANPFDHDLCVTEFPPRLNSIFPSFFRCRHPGSGSIAMKPSAMDRQRRRATRRS